MTNNRINKPRREIFDFQLKQLMTKLADKEGLTNAHLAKLESIEFREDVDLTLSKNALVKSQAKFRCYFDTLLANLGHDFLGCSPICETLTMSNVDLVYVLYYEHMYRRYRNNGRVHFATDGVGASFYLAQERTLYGTKKLEGLYAGTLPAVSTLDKKSNPPYLFHDESQYIDAIDEPDPGLDDCHYNTADCDSDSEFD